ncbi:MAG: hypothetical protein COY40_03910 [Alphaproteobacteria bacterium CG_4_10_14_0_8_um_filter_53_9]|nr:MAG: hypothetical protein COY40_03910 [Alphaproteobacteria bacterium CG_4_10_14_0_8_um_filter_53_9]
MAGLVPTDVRLSKDKRLLTLAFEARDPVVLGVEVLRLNSPSAEVKGHFGQGGKVPEIAPDLTITALEPVGHYALKIVFSDGHATGLYPWEYLANLPENA